MIPILAIAHTLWLDTIRRKDAYVLLILLGTLFLILISLNVFGLGRVVRYVKDVGLLLAWVFAWILAVLAGTREMPLEETRGTVFPLLAKPVTRCQVICGKWLGAWSVVAVSTLLFYAMVLGVAAAMGGRVSFLAALQGYALHAIALGVITSLGLLFSTRLHADAAASLTFVLTGAATLVLPRIPEFMTRQGALAGGVLMFLYHVLPHFEVFDMRKRIVHDYGPASWGSFALAAAYGLALAALFVLLAWAAYRNKRFSRGGIG